MIVATSALSKHAEEAMEGQWVGTHTLTLDELDRSAIDWGQFSWAHPDYLRIRQPKIPRPHQEWAIVNVLEGFQTADRGKLIMACGTGKTLTGLHLVEGGHRFSADAIDCPGLPNAPGMDRRSPAVSSFVCGVL